ncbi:DUF3545 family protein [Shewanella sp. NIFS-20-20]|uniref:DUF3545 family protein n=1 Tax=Shewanella sp. NIFS-20-20 TaxID=2853806 RepID=UPI001C47C176|nr:DUF3545 family protein [Shewanella sp. NIFS-20-20]MBV7314197.1 DUF3545 family protein [Shewanella sp. NIFS-20-20]
MDRLDYGSAQDNVVEKPNRRNSKKRKWREIEAIKDKRRLLKELQDINGLCDLDIDIDAIL